MLSNCASAAEVSNLVNPVNYHVNHVNELDKIDETLQLYRKVSLVGISGIGKTQLARKYACKNAGNYNIIWFFDCNSSLDYQYVLLAKEINRKMGEEKVRISEEIDNAQKSIMQYFAARNDYLLVFDNLKINQNKKIKNIINWEHNGHIILCSQDSSNLKQVINIPYLKEEESINLVRSVGPNIPNDLIKSLVSNSEGYPIALARSAIFLDENIYITSDEYNTYFKKTKNNMDTYMDIVINKISGSSRELLYTIALLNNKRISKSLMKEVSNEETFIEDLISLNRYNLISLIESKGENKIFEMHDKIKSTILKREPKKVINQYLSNIIDKINKLMPEGKDAKQALVVNDNTLLENLETLLENAEKYDVALSKILELRKNLMSIYLGMAASRCQELTEWFFHNETNLCGSRTTKTQKAVCGEYLTLIGIYNYFVKVDYILAMNHFKKAEKFIDSLKGYPELKYLIYSQLAQVYLHRGERPLTKLYVSKSEAIEEKYPNRNYDAHLLPYIKTRSFMFDGNYQEALKVVNGVMELIKHQPIDYYNGNVYVVKASIQNSLGEFKKSYDVLKKIYDMEIKNILSGEAGGIRLKVVIELSRAELGLGKLEKALYHANQAVEIYIKDSHRDNSNLYTSDDIELAEAFVVQGDALAELGKLKNAIDAYSQAEVIFFNHYKEYMANLDEISALYKKAVIVSQKLGDNYLFNKFKKRHLDKFGLDHYRSKELLELADL